MCALVNLLSVFLLNKRRLTITFVSFLFILLEGLYVEFEARFLIAVELPARCGNTSAIRFIAIRETSVSRHHGGPIEGSTEIPQYIMALSYCKNGTSIRNWFRKTSKWHFLIGGDLNFYPPRCRQMLVSRTCNFRFFSLSYGCP